jgi:nucleoside-diphosphate-sugar epimerase
MRIAVFGASGKSGALVVSRLCDRGHDVVALSRDPARRELPDSRAKTATADLTDSPGMAAVLAGIDRVVSLAHARFTEGLLVALPATCSGVVLTGSVRLYTQLTDDAADDVRAGEEAFLRWRKSGGLGVMLHPSMIYGAAGDRNVGRILAVIRRWPRALPLVLPLPGGGRHTVQPVFADDFADAVAVAASATGTLPATLDIVGPEAISYAAMVRECAAALGRRATIVPAPVWAFGAAANVLGMVGIHLPFTSQEFARGAENKAFDPGPMTKTLGVFPRAFGQGVREKIAREAD